MDVIIIMNNTWVPGFILLYFIFFIILLLPVIIAKYIHTLLLINILPLY